MKKNTLVILLLFSFIILSCAEEANKEESSKEPVYTIKKENLEKAKRDFNKEEVSKDEEDQKLSVNSKCI